MANNRNGSALLIVIGFLSFMIVSAVAFSIYMRAERLPSSAYRRTVATRQLAKAALAEAISQVDDAVRGAPFPGLDDNISKNYHPHGVAENENYWEGNRVFMPPNPEYDGKHRRTAPASATVSVLTLEGLGYVPPPLVNDARFLSRGTWTAAWQNLPYDAGRFAFMALNVSDFFDINRLYANKARTANAVGRISLAYLFDPNYKPMANGTTGESTSVDNFAAGSVKQFDQLVHEQRQGGNDNEAIGSDAPFVSMLDYQLSMKQGISGVMPSMFYNWIDQSGADRQFCAAGADTVQFAGRQPFVTDSAATNQTWDVDIAYYEAPNGRKQRGQPFDNKVSQDTISFMQVNAEASRSKFFTPLMEHTYTGRDGETVKFASGVDGLSMIAATMFDYLDHNDVPLSLAWPCVERVPMICAVEPVFQFTVPSVQAVTAGDTTTWNFDPNQWLQAGMLSVTWAYPFKRNESDRNDTFKAQAIMRVFLAPDGLTLRAAEGLGNVLRPKNPGDWTTKTDMFKVDNQQNVFCLTFTLGEQNISLQNNVREDTQAGGTLQFPVNVGAIGGLSVVPLVSRTKVQNPQSTQPAQNMYTVNVSPLDLTGKPMIPVGTQMEEGAFNAAASAANLRPYVAVWVRIVNGDGKTVDLVPAVIDDDMTLNGGNSQVGVLSNWQLTSQDGPLLRFQGSATFNYTTMVNGTAAPGANAWEPSSFSALDPRFNWAPEDWYATEAGMTSFQKWLDKTNAYLRSGQADDRGCDHDIFCAVSNQGFLQSLGEFAFLPRLTNPFANGTPLLAVKAAAKGYDGVVRTAPQDVANNQCAWCSYIVDHEVYEAFSNMGVGRSTSQECLVNPYTPSRDIFMAALANTPCDYWAAGVALSEDVKLKSQLGDKELPKVETASDGLKYAFSEKSQGGQARLSFEKLKRIAETLQGALRDENNIVEGKNKVMSGQAADAWTYIWDEKLNWFTDRGSPDFYKFLGVELDEPLYDIDRKFLCSYWRDCFGNQQQLFLIFVRAESSAIGGPGEGTPAQKGARAVALVWRNPVATRDNNGPDGVMMDNNANWIDDRRPHQTRILFYHQFD